MVEQGSPTLGWISLLHRVTPDPVSNNARTFSPPREISALGRENSGRVVLKQFRAVRHVRSCWGLSCLKTIPSGRFPMTMGFLGTCLVPFRENSYPPHRGHVHVMYTSYMPRPCPGKGKAGLALEGPNCWQNQPLLVLKGVPCPLPLLAVNGVCGLLHCLIRCPI